MRTVVSRKKRSDNSQMHPNRKRREALLSATEMIIPLHRLVRLRELGNRPDETVLEPGDYMTGTVRSEYILADGQWELTLDYRTDTTKPRVTRFIRGHEEGHVCEITGNLIEVYRLARSLGIGHLLRIKATEARRLDKEAKKILHMQPPDVKHLHEKYEGNNETSADVCGLIALIKSGCDPELIGMIAEQIRRDNNNFFRRIPDLIYTID